MLHIDLPTSRELRSLSAERHDACVSIYVATTPVTQQADAARIEFGNLAREARTQLEAAGLDKRRLDALSAGLADLSEDRDFWAMQAYGLAVHATPDRVRTWRLPNRLVSAVHVSDRFHLKPMLRAVSFPHAAYVLAVSEGGVRLVEMAADLPPSEVKVPGLPKDAASAAGKSTLNDPTHSTRVHGGAGQKLRLMQYSRKIDAAIRPLLTGSDTPLILAATEPVASIYRGVNTYGQLLDGLVAGSPDRLTDAELAAAARPVLDAAYAAEIDAIGERFRKFAGEGRATTDLSDAARAATFGAIDTLLGDMDNTVPGLIDEQTGALTLDGEDDAQNYGVVDEIAARALASGAQIYAVRRADLPGEGDLAAILRHPV